MFVHSNFTKKHGNDKVKGTFMLERLLRSSLSDYRGALLCVVCNGAVLTEATAAGAASVDCWRLVREQT